MTRAARCEVEVADASGFHFRPCGRPAKADGLCGVHLRARAKRRESNERFERERAESEAARRRADAACAELRALGFDAYPEYHVPVSGLGRFTGKIVVDPDVILRRARGKG